MTGQKFASLAKSPRLRRTLAALEDAPDGLTTLEVIQKGMVASVSSAVSELRCNGCDIDCTAEHGLLGRVWRYRLVSAPENWRG